MARYRLERLERHHLRQQFSCGSADLDRYLHQQARQEQSRTATVVYVLCVDDGQEVAEFFTLSSCSIEASNLQPDFVRRLPRYPLLPAILIGRLAVDRRYQGQGLGASMIGEALTISLGLSDRIGAVAVVVEAKDESAARFYARYGFIPFLGDSRRLYLPMSTVAQGILSL